MQYIFLDLPFAAVMREDFFLNLQYNFITDEENFESDYILEFFVGITVANFVGLQTNILCKSLCSVYIKYKKTNSRDMFFVGTR